MAPDRWVVREVAVGLGVDMEGLSQQELWEEIVRRIREEERVGRKPKAGGLGHAATVR